MQPMQSNVHGGRGDVLTGWAQHFNDTINTEDWSIALTFHNKAETNETNLVDMSKNREFSNFRNQMN